MERQFNLVLTNRWKTTILVLAITAGFLLLLGLALTLFVRQHFIGVVAGLAATAGFVFLPEHLAKQFGAEYATALIDHTGLRVQHEATGRVQRIDFADMVSYSTGIDFDFTVRSRIGGKLQFHLNNKLHPQGLGPLLAMQQHLRWAVADYQQRHPDQPPILSLGFFDGWWAVAWLLLFAGLLAWLGWRAVQPFASEGAWGGFLLFALIFIIYASLWGHHRFWCVR